MAARLTMAVIAIAALTLMLSQAVTLAHAVAHLRVAMLLP